MPTLPPPPGTWVVGIHDLDYPHPGAEHVIGRTLHLGNEPTGVTTVELLDDAYALLATASLRAATDAEITDIRRRHAACTRSKAAA